MSGAHDCVELQVPLEALGDMSYFRGEGEWASQSAELPVFLLAFSFQQCEPCILYISVA